MGRIRSGGGHHSINFCDVISLDNLLAAWQEFRRGKRLKSDVALFELSLEDNIFRLHTELVSATWRPGPYISFSISDPKPRRIHKASVRDRVLHQALYRQLYPIFDESFIHDSYSSRDSKGTHAGVLRLESFIRKASRNWSGRVFVLQCDVRKFFNSVDHFLLLSLLARRLGDTQLMRLIERIIGSFSVLPDKGLPLGNVTSQLFANVYLNELDQFVKHTLHERFYVRYCDDFAIVSENQEHLAGLVPMVRRFLRERLTLDLHERKVTVRPVQQGIDFLGYVILPHRRVLRTRTKRRMFRRIKENESEATRQSYLGLLSHGNTWKLQQKISECGTLTRMNPVRDRFACGNAYQTMILLLRFNLQREFLRDIRSAPCL